MKMRNTGESRLGYYISYVHCYSVGLFRCFFACLFSYFTTSGIVFHSYCLQVILCCDSASVVVFVLFDFLFYKISSY